MLQLPLVSFGAGSERVSRSEASGDRLVEARHINRSLSALGSVMAVNFTSVLQILNFFFMLWVSYAARRPPHQLQPLRAWQRHGGNA